VSGCPLGCGAVLVAMHRVGRGSVGEEDCGEGGEGHLVPFGGVDGVIGDVVDDAAEEGGGHEGGECHRIEVAAEPAAALELRVVLALLAGGGFLGAADAFGESWVCGECAEGVETCHTKWSTVLVVEDQDDVFDLLPEIGGVGAVEEFGDGRDGVVEALCEAFDGGLFDEVAEVVEVMVERPVGDAGEFKDGGEADLFEWGGVEQFDGHVEEALGVGMPWSCPLLLIFRCRCHASSPLLSFACRDLNATAKSVLLAVTKNTTRPISQKKVHLRSIFQRIKGDV